MNTLLAIIPKSIPAAKKALTALERDLESTKTYDAIRAIERAADAIKLLFAEVQSVRQQAEAVMVFANFRIGEEVVAQPKAKGGGDKRSDHRVSRKHSDPPSLKDLVGSTTRGMNLKRLVKLGRAKVKKLVEQLHEQGQDANVTAVLKLAQPNKKVRRAEREQVLANKITALPEKQFGVILADPPWRFAPYSSDTGMDRAADNHYPTMTVDAIKALGIPAARDCVLFLWATVPMLVEAFDVMKAWGFEYKSSAVWVKDKSGTGFWFMNQHELLLLGTRGNVPAPAPGERFSSVISAPRAAHSAKPFAVHEMIESMFPNLPRLEMFARERFDGWDAWGNEAA